MAKNKTKKPWVQGHINDPFVKQAQQDGYRARAAYKLMEIDEREKLIKPGQVIVDLGCAPGSWSQYVRNKLAAKEGIQGTIVGLDMLPMDEIADVHFIQGDFREDEVLEQLEAVLDGQKVDLVLSDMAPNLSGIADADAARMAYLAELAIAFAQAHLKPSGALLIKCFHGQDYDEIVAGFREAFKTVSTRKPKASRNKSAETFLLGKTLKN